MTNSDGPAEPFGMPPEFPEFPEFNFDLPSPGENPRPEDEEVKTTRKAVHEWVDSLPDNASMFCWSIMTDAANKGDILSFYEVNMGWVAISALLAFVKAESEGFMKDLLSGASFEKPEEDEYR